MASPAPVPDRPSRRAQHRQKTRDALLSAARTLFGRRGFEPTSMDDIAALAGVSRRTSFRYFPSKTELVFPHAEERILWFEQTLLAGGPDEPMDTLVERTFTALAAEFQRNKAELLLQRRLIEECPLLLAHERALDDRWEAALRKALSARLPAEHAAIWAGALFGVMRVVLRQWFAAEGKTDLAALGNAALRTVTGPWESPARRAEAAS